MVFWFYISVFALLAIIWWLNSEVFELDIVEPLIPIFALIWVLIGALLLMAPNVFGSLPLREIAITGLFIELIMGGTVAVVWIVPQIESKQKAKREAERRAKNIELCNMFGHNWDGHNCLRCGAWRKQHNLNGCVCVWCGQEFHNWVETDDYYSERKGGDSYRIEYTCSRCGKTYTDSHWFPRM